MFFYDYAGVGLAELWDRVWVLSAHWASISPEFSGIALSLICSVTLTNISLFDLSLED